MGSPNFNTSSNILLNLATFSDNDDEPSYDHADTVAELKADIDKLQDMNFHEIVIEYGYHEGFQVMLMALMPDDYIGECMADMHKYNECYLPDGNKMEMQDLNFSPSNAVNCTKHNISRTINKEFKYAFNELLKLGHAYGLGEVHGKTWTSHVGEITSTEL